MACGISFLSDNLMNDSLITLTTGTENAQFPLSNVNNDATAVKFRSQENVVVIEIDMQQTRTINTFAIHGDTNEDFGLTAVSFKTSLTTDFSGSVVTNVALSAEHLIGYDYLATPVNHRFVEITLTGTGSFVEVSNIFIGERIELLQQNLSIDSFGYGFNDQSRVSSNKYGQKFVDKRNKIKNLSGVIQYCIQSEQAQLDEMFIRHGKSEPVWMIVDKGGTAMTDGEYKLSIYGYFDKAPKWTASGGQTYNTSVEIEQAG